MVTADCMIKYTLIIFRDGEGQYEQSAIKI